MSICERFPIMAHFQKTARLATTSRVGLPSGLILDQRKSLIDKAIRKVEDQLRVAIRKHKADAVLKLSEKLNRLTMQRISI